MRRSLSLWLSILLSFTLIATACGDDGDSSPPDDGSGETDSEGGQTPDAPDTDLETEEGVLDGEQITSAGEGTDDTDLDPVYGGDMKWGLNRDGTGFDLTGAVAPGSLRLLTTMADGLTRVTADGGWGPFLAESLVPNDDFTVWTVTLREGVLFHNGTELDANAVVANLQAFKDSALTGAVVAQVEEYVVTGDLTFEARMTAPWAAWPRVLARAILRPTRHY